MTAAAEAPLTPFGLRLDAETYPDPDAVVAGLVSWALERRPRQIGYPVATDVDYSPLKDLFNVFLNNIGDPRQPCAFNNSQQIEREVIAWFADMVGLPATDRWGYITGGGTEGNLAGVHAGLRRFPDAVIYRTRAAHYSAQKIAEIVGRVPREIVVDIDAGGEMDYDDFDRLVAQHRDRPAIVLATAGTTMTEARDDIDRINAILDQHHVSGRWVHVDAALSGVILAFDGTLNFVLSRIDSLTISGHKWFGTPLACGVMLMRNSAGQAGAHVAYTGTFDTTISGSRSGQAAVLLWYAIATISRRPGGHRQRIAEARQNARHTYDRLRSIGWPVGLHDHAVTVFLRTPPAAMVTDKSWILATENEITHIICMPGVARQTLDQFVDDLAALIAAGTPEPPFVPQPRHRAPISLEPQAT